MPYLFFKKENILTIKYILCILISFILTIYPIFNFEGKLQDNDLQFFINMDFNQYLNIIKNDLGLWRIIAFSFEYIIPKIFENVPYKSYIVLLTFYLTYYILCEKILSLLKFSENVRLLIFLSLTSTIFILPTMLTWTRTQNEFLSILISWFFISKIVNSQSTLTSSFFVIAWGIFSLLSYELHFPFLIILLFCFGFINRKTILLGILALPIILYIIPPLKYKINVEFSHLVSSLFYIFPYLENKFDQFIFTYQEVSLLNTITPLILVSIAIILHSINSKNIIYKPQYSYINYCLIVILSFFLLIIFFTIAWPSSLEQIVLNGKLNWNVINVFWLNILIILTYNYKNMVLNKIMFIPIFLVMLSSGILARIMNHNIYSNKTDILINGLFKNILSYVVFP